MAEPKHGRRARDEPEEEPEPLEAGLRGPSYGQPDWDPDAEPDEYLLPKVVEANGEHHRTMRWGLGLGTLVLLLSVSFGPLLAGRFGTLTVGVLTFLIAGMFLGIGLHALQRQLELLRRAVAAADHFLFEHK